jgi:hypothetical protein
VIRPIAAHSLAVARATRLTQNLGSPRLTTGVGSGSCCAKRGPRARKRLAALNINANYNPHKTTHAIVGSPTFS